MSREPTIDPQAGQTQEPTADQQIPVRVALVALSATGGIAAHVGQLRADLATLGATVITVTDAVTRTSLEPGWARDQERSGACDQERSEGSTVLVGRREPPTGARPRRARRWWPSSARRALAGADVVHAHGFRAGLLAAALTPRRVPVVISLHNEMRGRGPRHQVGALVARVVLRRAALVTGASTDLVELARDLGARRAELAEVPSARVPDLLTAPVPGPRERAGQALRLLAREGVVGSDDAEKGGAEPLQSTAPGSDGPPTPALVLTIARVAPQKDLATLVDAAARARDRTPAGRAPASWVVVGAGDPQLREELRTRAEALRAPVHLVGAQGDVSAWLRAASVLVLTSEWEARALVVQEALAAGTPVVATAVGGLPDLLTGIGALVPPGDPAAVAAEVARVLDDPEEAGRRATAGRERAAGWADGITTARRWLARYAQLRA